MSAGDRVVVLVGAKAGREGTVRHVLEEAACGCRTVFVRLDASGEWAGKPDELRVLGRA